MTGGGGGRPPDETRLEGSGAPDETRLEVSGTPDETRLEGPAGADETRREPPAPSDATVPESSAGADATRAEDAPASRAGAAPVSTAGFPEELAARFRPVRELDHGSQADVWLVEDDAGVPFVAKVYRPGFEGRREILEILHGLEANEDVVPVVDYGRANGRLYVVLEYVPGGNLKGLMTPGAPAPPDLVREVLAQLVAGLERLHGAGIEHQDLKPGNVLVRSRQPLDLVLADFGVATQTSETVRATRLGGMTWAYAPPEAFALRREELTLWRHKYDTWSLGVIVVELLTGRHPLPRREAAIATFFVTRGTDDLVEGVDDPAWRKLCRGLLRRDPEARWGTAEARLWLESPDSPDLDVQDEAAPSVPSRGFRFVGRDYATVADLGAAMAGDWEMARDVWRNQLPNLLQWLRHELGATEPAALLERIDREADMDLDTQLFWAIRVLARELPPSFQGEPLTAENLARIASRAAARTDGDDARLLMAVSRIRQIEEAGDPALGAQAARWSAATAAYEELSAEREELPEPSETDRVMLLAAATEGSGVTEQLRERTWKVLDRWPRAPQCDWFRRLGDPRRAEAPRLLAMALLAGPAHDRALAEFRARRKAERAAEAERRAEVTARRKTRLLAIGAGALAGVVFCFCLWGLNRDLALHNALAAGGNFSPGLERLETVWISDNLEAAWNPMEIYRSGEVQTVIGWKGGKVFRAFAEDLSKPGALVILIFVVMIRLFRNRTNGASRAGPPESSRSARVRAVRSWDDWPDCLVVFLVFALFVLLALALAYFLVLFLTTRFIHLVFEGALILGYSIPGPLLVDVPLLFAGCLGIGVGLAACLKLLDRRLTARTGLLAMLAITLVVALVSKAIGTVSLPG